MRTTNNRRLGLAQVVSHVKPHSMQQGAALIARTQAVRAGLNMVSADA